MAELGHKVVYLLVEKGTNGNKKTYWRPHGVAYPCRDGSLNLKLEIHPGLVFNIRDPKSNGERQEVEDDDEAGVQHFPARFITVQAAQGAPLDGSDYNSATFRGGDIVDDRSFRCEDCLKTVPNDEAHAIFSGGAVCSECGGKYRSCGRCDYYFLRNLPGKVCPNCRKEA